LETAGVDWIHGRGVLESPGKLRVEKNEGGCVEVRAKAIILATGSRPVRLEEFGWEARQFVTSEEVLRNFRLPRSAIILGGGAIGCELATIYSGLGVPCTLLEREERLLPEFPAPAGREVAKALQRSGADVWTDTHLTGAQAQGAELRLTTGDGRTVSAGQVVVAVGRKANFNGIDAEALGLKTRDGVIQVNSRAETNLPGVYAVGDVAQRKQYAHLAMRMGEVAADNAVGRDAREEALWVPQCVYTRPQVARVGLDERQVRRYSNDVRVAEFSYRAAGMARATGQTSGQVTLVLTGAGHLWGATVVGASATELIHELTLAAGCGVALKQWATMIHAHPTFSEVISEAARVGLSSEPLR
jgi:dihydrolipoamide dehydrogenase